MSLLCVSGYGSLDHAVTLDGFVEGDRTTLIRSRDAEAWPRIGGCPAYVARAVVSAGEDAQVISWMGANTEGLLYRNGLEASGVGGAGVTTIEADRSPTALLVYQADGSCACLYDPALDGQEVLTETQADLIRQASHFCLSVGPPQVVGPILDALAEDTHLYWLTKNDAHAFSPEICAMLSQRADVIICNQAERALIASTGKQPVIIETRGDAGVLVEAPDISQIVPVDPVSAPDPTGAGDTFAGHFIATQMNGVDDPVRGCEHAVGATKRFLEHRLVGEGR